MALTSILHIIYYGVMFRQTDACISDSIRINQQLEPNKYTLRTLHRIRKTNLIKAIISSLSDFAAFFLTSPFSSNLHVWYVSNLLCIYRFRSKIISTRSKLKIALEYEGSIHILMFNASVKCKYSDFLWLFELMTF